MTNPNIIPHQHKIDRSARAGKYSYHPLLLWFTGLSGSGKSTLANSVEEYFFKRGMHTYILDGDNIRSGLNSDLDFSEHSRKENIRRIGEVSKLFIDAGVITLTAFISPFKEDRKIVKDLVGTDMFAEIFVDCPLEICEQRDVKGLYAKARKGQIKNFTGIDSPFEKPENPDVHVRTDKQSLETCTQKIIEFIKPKIES
ncbi:MAG: adenylyl-sulfate kinase [Bacteroidetes bacterium]|nr:adenylyl-sulfate kinase [Bacteroidota bacterium]MDA1119327.1 adenylyl-sulfate kinase [Bacteroidota bacterium]